MTVVIMMDIDDFKTINDTYGHAEGDKALIIVSDSIKKAINSHNMPSFIGRYGGDEFILIIHPVTLDEIEQLISEIRSEIESRTRELPYPLAISVGYDEMRNKQDTFQNSILRADTKLYQDKKYRKNNQN